MADIAPQIDTSTINASGLTNFTLPNLKGPKGQDAYAQAMTSLAERQLKGSSDIEAERKRLTEPLQQQMTKGYETYFDQAKERAVINEQVATAGEDIAKWAQEHQVKNLELPEFKPEKINQQDLNAASSVVMAFAVLGSKHSLNKGAAVGNALAGAIEGYTKGNQIKFEQDYRTFKTNFDKLVKQHEYELQEYKSVLDAKNMDLSAKMRRGELKALEMGDSKMAIEMASHNIDRVEKELNQRQSMLDKTINTVTTHLRDMQTHFDMIEQKNLDRALKEKMGQQNIDLKKLGLDLRTITTMGKPGVQEAMAFTPVLGRQIYADSATKIKTGITYVEGLKHMIEETQANPNITGVRMAVYAAINKYLPSDPNSIVTQEDVDTARARANDEVSKQLHVDSDKAMALSKQALDTAFAGAARKYGGNRVPVTEFKAVQNVLAPQVMTANAFNTVANQEIERTVNGLHGIVTPQEFDKVYNYYQNEMKNAPSELYDPSLIAGGGATTPVAQKVQFPAGFTPSATQLKTLENANKALAEGHDINEIIKHAKQNGITFEVAK